jgi:hypothetical protein
MNAHKIFAALSVIFLSGVCHAAADEKRRDETAVDVAPFAKILSWDPKATEGTKALRSDEFPAADLAPYQEMLPMEMMLSSIQPIDETRRKILGNGSITYLVPIDAGQGDIGLEWDEGRILQQVGFELADSSIVPPVETVQLQYWAGESAWQGKWKPASIAPTIDAKRWTWQFGPEEVPQGTLKVRWVFSGVKEDTTAEKKSGMGNRLKIKKLSAFTRSNWNPVKVRIEPARPAPASSAVIDIYNGIADGASDKNLLRCSWDGKQPLELTVHASESKPYKADRTVLRFQFDDAKTPNFGVAVEDLLTHDCVYVPEANVFVTREPSPVTAADYLKKIEGRKTIIEKVRERPDQDLRHACEVIHNRTQDCHNWVPMLISLACDNRKFLVHREGSIQFNEYNRPDDYPGESDGIHTTAANVGQWRFTPAFGVGRPMELARHLSGGWLPMPVTTWKDKNVTYRQTTFIAPVGEASADKPAWFREKALGVAEYSIKNAGAEPADVRLAFKFAPEQDPAKIVKYEETPEGIVATSDNRILAFIMPRDSKKTLSCKVEPTGVTFTGELSGGEESTIEVFLPAWEIGANDKSVESFASHEDYAADTEKYWKTLLDPAMQIDTPDEFLNNLIKASQVNCMLAARNQELMKYLVPWISSVHFAYPESEANSILRGMDMAGHPDFTQRGLEFYLKESNPAGYITILVHNKVANVKCGYTLVGTGEVLWTLGENYERTHDKAWLKKVAPDVVRICQWVMRQREKTKRVDFFGEKVPEYGLTPPGVTADWNRFAYRFFNEAQYWRGLEMAGKALADIGDPAADAILADAKAYREDIARAYHAMQGKMPVVPLQNGAWVPADPSLIGCYGNVEDFMPGEDAGRSYVYSVEIGAHHLAATETFAPTSKDAEWMIDYLEDVQFLARKNWYKDMSAVDPFDWGGFAKMQPYYCRIAEIYALRDDVKPFLRSYFNPIPAQVNFEDLTFWEDMGTSGYATGAWNKTHETGWFLAQTRLMFAIERGGDLWLAPFVTNAWLKDGQKVSVRNLPTRFGKVGYTIDSRTAEGEIEATVNLPKDCPAKNVVLRLRHPEGKPMQSASVDGKKVESFDPKKETLTFPPSQGTIKVRVKY